MSDVIEGVWFCWKKSPTRIDPVIYWTIPKSELKTIIWKKKLEGAEKYESISVLEKKYPIELEDLNTS